MSRLIVECPICGAWSGPMDGDASEVAVEVCELCRDAIAKPEAA